MREREASNEIIVDQESTIKKFRELVQKQQEQNIELRQALEKETNKPIATPSEIIDFKVTEIRWWRLSISYFRFFVILYYFWIQCMGIRHKLDS